MSRIKKTKAAGKISPRGVVQRDAVVPSQDRGLTEAGSDLWSHSTQAGPSRAGCPGLCPDDS